MLDTEKEKDYWSEFIGQRISISKKINGKDFFYNGIITSVLDGKLMIKDRKLGLTIVTFDGINLIGIRDANNSEGNDFDEVGK